MYLRKPARDALFAFPARLIRTIVLDEFSQDIIRLFAAVQFHPEITARAAKLMALRDGVPLQKVMGDAPANYSRTLRILDNFLQQH